MGALTYFSRNIWIYGSYVSTGLNESQNGKTAIKKMTYEIRGASSSNTGAYAISLATSTDFTFHSNIDDDGLIERVRYFLSGSELRKGVIKPTGSPLTYNSANETLSTLIPDVTSTSIFSYYDENYDGTTTALTSPINIPAIRLVKIIITTDKDPNRAPAAATFSTEVSIRNLKDNL